MLSRGALGLASSRVRRGVALSWSVLFILSLLLQYATFALAPAALAVHNDGLFELDGNAVHQAAAGDDWDQVFGGTSNAEATKFVTDEVDSQADDSFTGGSTKDINDTTDWLWTNAKVGQPKNDITHAFAAAYTGIGDSAGDTVIYFGLDKFEADGDNFVGFWFLQGAVGPVGDGNPPGSPFSGAHHAGDILVLADYTNGGAIATFKVYKWVASGGDTTTHLDLVASGVPCTGAPATDDACAATNHDTVTAPWPYDGRDGDPGEFPPGTFFEGGINLTNLGIDGGCFSTFIAETRASQSVDATLSDFASGTFSFCQPPTIATQVEQDGQSLGSVGTISKGDSVTDTATLTGTKGTVEGTVDFFRCFDASSTPDCSSGGTKTGVTKNLSGGKATSTAFTPANVGFYCFRVEYTPAAGSKYLASSHTNQTTECFQVLAATVTIGKTADDGSVSAGDPIGFTLTWGNSGPGKATGVVVTDPLPGDAGLDWSIDGSTGTGSSCEITGSPGSQVLTCDVGTIAGNTAVSGTVHVTSDTTAATCGSVDNKGSIDSENDGSADDSASVVVNCPDVTVLKSAKVGVLHVGDTAEWDIVVTNIGKGTARNVTLTDPLPGNISWQVSHAGCSIASSTLTCSLGDLAPNASVTIVVTGNTDTEGSETEDCIVLDNTATVTSSNEPAAAQGNNESSASITVTCSSALLIDKTVSGNTGGTFNDPTDPNNPLNGLKQARIGDTLTYHLQYSGAGPLTNAVITDEIPAGLAYVVGSACASGQAADEPDPLANPVVPPCATSDPNFVYQGLSGGILTWKAATLPDPANGSVTFKVKVLKAAAENGIIDNVAVIDSAETEPDSGEVPVGVLPPPEALTPPPTSTVTPQTATSNPGFTLMLVLLGMAGVTLGIGFVTPAPARVRRRNRPG
jgi:uncharacterized repeat protein (TIGR01451 family)